MNTEPAANFIRLFMRDLRTMVFAKKLTTGLCLLLGSAMLLMLASACGAGIAGLDLILMLVAFGMLIALAVSLSKWSKGLTATRKKTVFMDRAMRKGSSKFHAEEEWICAERSARADAATPDPLPIRVIKRTSRIILLCAIAVAVVIVIYATIFASTQ